MNRFWLIVKSYFPQKLPVGLTEFNSWAANIIEITGAFADPDSMKFAIASNILHLPPNRSSVSTQFFVRSLRKAAANQVASQVFQDIKNKQQEEAKAAATQSQVAAPTQNAEGDFSIEKATV